MDEIINRYLVCLNVLKRDFIVRRECSYGLPVGSEIIKEIKK